VALQQKLCNAGVELMISSMIGTELNVAGIVLGGIVGLMWRRPLSAGREAFFKAALGLFTVYYGLRLTWTSLGGSVGHVLKQLLLAVLSLMLGKLLGRLLRLQKLSNRIGQTARDRISAARPDNPDRFSDGFKICAALFCAAPLGPIGAVQDGLTGYCYPLGVKAVMDGLAAYGFASLFGGGVILAGLPVLAWQGTITVVCQRLLEPWLRTHGLVDPINAVGGLLVFSVALVILGVKKIELADYLPSLVVAPLLAWCWM
jgi:uncharacterized membrane protein YqgA involved in biofilm formation